MHLNSLTTYLRAVCTISENHTCKHTCKPLVLRASIKSSPKSLDVYFFSRYNLGTYLKTNIR